MSEVVSVLMPVFNEERHIVEAITSVLAQKDVELELLVIDGNSADRTRALVAGLAREDPRIFLLDNPETKIPAGLNVGLREATGAFVARVDGHAKISDDYIARAVRWMHEDASVAAVGGRRLGISDSATGRSVAMALSSPFGVGNSINHYGTEVQLSDHASFGVYRADVARAVGGWDENLLVNEDVDFDHRIQQAGHRIGYHPDMVIFWQVRTSVRDLFHQYRRYGRGKAWMIKKNGPSALRLRHLVPPAGVVAGALVAATSLRRPAWVLLTLPYAAGIAAATLHALRHHKPDEEISTRTLPAAFVAMHFAWGLGFWEGLVLNLRPATASSRSVGVANVP